MRWVDGLVGTAMATSLLLGNGQTPSDRVRPPLPPDRAEASSTATGQRLLPRRLRPQRIGELAGLGTHDVGFRLKREPFSALIGTGPDLLVYPPHAPTAVVGQGVPSAPLPLPPHTQAIRSILEKSGLSETKVAHLLKVSRIAVRFWKEGGAIRDHHRMQVLETQDLLQRAMRQHPTKEQLLAWLDGPEPESGASPASLIRDGDFGRARLLAMLSPTGVAPLPAWAREPIAAAWEGALEQPERPGELLVNEPLGPGGMRG